MIEKASKYKNDFSGFYAWLDSELREKFIEMAINRYDEKITCVCGHMDKIKSDNDAYVIQFNDGLGEICCDCFAICPTNWFYPNQLNAKQNEKFERNPKTDWVFKGTKADFNTEIAQKKEEIKSKEIFDKFLNYLNDNYPIQHDKIINLRDIESLRQEVAFDWTDLSRYKNQSNAQILSKLFSFEDSPEGQDYWYAFMKVLNEELV